MEEVEDSGVSKKVLFGILISILILIGLIVFLIYSYINMGNEGGLDSRGFSITDEEGSAIGIDSRMLDEEISPPEVPSERGELER